MQCDKNKVVIADFCHFNGGTNKRNEEFWEYFNKFTEILKLFIESVLLMCYSSNIRDKYLVKIEDYNREVKRWQL
ncbi:hypothetical protein AAAC51_33995 [Priestia megaterium]